MEKWALICLHMTSANQVPAVGDLFIDDATVLTRNRYWVQTHNWSASLECPGGAVGVGMCSSGKNEDCYGQTKALLCASRSDGAVVKNNAAWGYYKNSWSPEIVYCPNGYAVTSFCSSGKNFDCNKSNLAMRCSPVDSKYLIDYNHCTLKESKSWTGRIDATRPNDVMVGMCSSGQNPDCGRDSDVTKAAMFCPHYLRSADKGTHTIFRFIGIGNDRRLLFTNLGENPRAMYYEGIAFNLYDSNGADRAPLYRCMSGDDNFASTQSDCEGRTTHSMLGYMSTKTGAPIYRCYRSDVHHLITTNKAESDNNGYNIEGVLGYAP